MRKTSDESRRSNSSVAAVCDRRISVGGEIAGGHRPPLQSRQKVFRKEAGENCKLIGRRGGGDLTSKIFRAAQQKGEGFGKIAGRSVVIGAAVTAEPCCRW